MSKDKKVKDIIGEWSQPQSMGIIGDKSYDEFSEYTRMRRIAELPIENPVIEEAQEKLKRMKQLAGLNEMAITSIDGSGPIKPKQKAGEIIMWALDRSAQWEDDTWMDSHKMTSKEKATVEKQVEVYKKRIQKMVGIK